MPHTLHNRQISVVAIFFLAAFLRLLAWMVLVAPYQFHFWQALSAVPNIVYPHS